MTARLRCRCMSIWRSSRWEDQAVRERSGGLPAPAYLESLGLLEAKVIAAHGVWLTPDDIEVLARNDTAVVHCPCSNAKHASGVAAVPDMVALSADAAALHPVIEEDDDALSRIVWSGSPGAVSAVWVAGRKVVQDGPGAHCGFGRSGGRGRCPSLQTRPLTAAPRADRQTCGE